MVKIIVNTKEITALLDVFTATMKSLKECPFCAHSLMLVGDEFLVKSVEMLKNKSTEAEVHLSDISYGYMMSLFGSLDDYYSKNDPALSESMKISLAFYKRLSKTEEKQEEKKVKRPVRAEVGLN